MNIDTDLMLTIAAGILLAKLGWGIAMWLSGVFFGFPHKARAGSSRRENMLYAGGSAGRIKGG